MSSNLTDSVNYESPALVEVLLDGVEYRLDGGKQGTAVCISTRPAGTWDWTFGGEARWDGDLRSKAFERTTLAELARVFKQVLRDAE